MFTKEGKYYADWRDKDGHRTRKSFTSKRAALQFEAEQKELAHPKRRARGTYCPKSSAPTTTPKASTRTTGSSPTNSSRRLVLLRRNASRPRTSRS